MRWRNEGPLLFSGGEGGIRTHEGLLTLAGFQDQCIQPLCHLSVTGYATAHCAVSGASIQLYPAGQLRPRRTCGPNDGLNEKRGLRTGRHNGSRKIL